MCSCMHKHSAKLDESVIVCTSFNHAVQGRYHCLRQNFSQNEHYWTDLGLQRESLVRLVGEFGVGSWELKGKISIPDRGVH